LAGEGCCWHCAIGLGGELQNRSRSLDWDSVAHAAEHRRGKKKGHPYARTWVGSLSQMFPFRRSASDPVFLICDLECLNATGIFCFSERKNAPGNEFAAWRHMRFSDVWSAIME